MILGIDPGLGGALAFWWPERDELDVIDMPTYAITVNKGKRRVVDLAALASTIESRYPATAVIEDVHAMPKQGVSSSFTFGRVLGNIEALIAANGIPVRFVTPVKWKRYFGLTADKDAARKRASELMPRHAHHWQKRSHDGRAEAALIAYYGGLI